MEGRLESGGAGAAIGEQSGVFGQFLAERIAEGDVGDVARELLLEAVMNFAPI
jgi:hypothetical protein